MRTIMHIDMNSFYASCEIVESQGRYSHDTRLIVTGNPDARCGVVLAVSVAAKKFGIKAGMTIEDARNTCPDALYVKARFPLYFKRSRQVMGIIRNYSPLVEQYGLDEAFLDYAGSENLFGPAKEAAFLIKERIKRETGMTCSIGVATNKLLAKMGSDYKKPDAVTIMGESDFRRLLWPLPVRDLIFVGRQTGSKLNELGIFTVNDLAHAPVCMLKRNFGINGALLWMNANGLDETPVHNTSDPVKGIGNSSTLPGDAKTIGEIRVMLLAHSEQVAKRMRAIGKACRTVQITMKNSELEVTHHQMTFPNPTDLTEDIYNAASRLCHEIWDGRNVRLVGVRVTNLCDVPSCEQVPILPDDDYLRRKHLNVCIDDIRVKYGNNSVFRGAILAEGLNRSIWYEDVFMG